MKHGRSTRTAVALVVGTAVFALVQAGGFASEVKSAAKSVAEGSKKAGKEIAHESTKIGHAIADTSKEVGRETAYGAKSAWFKTRDFATEKSKRVADATVQWWDAGSLEAILR